MKSILVASTPACLWAIVLLNTQYWVVGAFLLIVVVPIFIGVAVVLLDTRDF